MTEVGGQSVEGIVLVESVTTYHIRNIDSVDANENERQAVLLLRPLFFPSDTRQV